MKAKPIKQKRLFLLAVLLLTCLSFPFAQSPGSEEKETDPLVLENLEEWQDLKFGFMMHWGPYSQWGVVESWSLCSEDVPWCQRKMDNYVEYVQAYEKLKETFNPVEFNPESWAEIAKEAGMKYVVFTTKHHDGFSMFDTKQTDYSITDPGCAFHSNPKANITKEIFDAFRKEGFKTGAYFSKPDWHSENYWWPYFATPDRHVNYNPVKYPDRWQKFKDFTYGQIEELMTGYGKVDILWLDGGWVRPRPELDSDKPIKPPYNQDIEMSKIATMARSHQPNLIIVDRTVKGKYENYTTPEQHIPEKALDYPWETCMTMGGSWSYVPNDTYKSTRTIVHNLVDIVAKGGNYLLNVGPSPEGTLPPDAISRMKDIGKWMKINGEAIYKTRAIAPYKEGNICFTANPDKSINMIYLAGEDELSLPEKVSIASFELEKGAKIYLLGYAKPLKWKNSEEGFSISIPSGIQKTPPCQYAWSFRVTKIKQ
ncbi:MAG: alpha-L-fucosidase [Bacteroidales bacterium]|nr:alpha-L-fucosidase [Bacteroidales bacterium]